MAATKSRRRWIICLLGLVVCIVGAICWSQMATQSFIERALASSSTDISATRLPDAIKEIQTSYFLSSLVIDSVILCNTATVKRAHDQTEGWIVSEIDPLQAYKGRLPSVSLFVLGLGNQKASIDDASVFSMNHPVRDGDRCLVFLRKHPRLSRLCGRRVYRCVKVIPGKAE